MIKFSSAVMENRPVRLSESTREWCQEVLNGVSGRELKKTLYVTMDDIPGFGELSLYDKYDLCIDRIVKQCPVIIREGELLCGSASLFSASWAQVPAQYNGNWVIAGTNHTTYNFARVLEVGLDSYEEEINARIERGADEIGMRTLKSMLNTINSFRIWHGRYVSELNNRIASAKDDKTSDYYKELLSNLKNVPFKKPSSFREALQSLFFTVEFTRLTGNFSGLGKIDRMLEGYFRADLESGAITMDTARELMAHFFIKGCEWITLEVNGSGDGMYFQNIVLAGVDEEGNENAGYVTKLILETVEELPIGDYPIAVRLNSNSPEWLVRKCAEVSRHGGGAIAFYDEETIIHALEDFGFSHSDAVNFSNDGCWEILIQGKTLFGYYPIDTLPALQSDTLGIDKTDEPNREYSSFEEIKNTVKFHIRQKLEYFKTLAAGWCARTDSPWCISGVASLLTDGCIEKATDYLMRGPVYAILSPHLGGLPDVANDLYALKKLVYDEKLITLDELITALKHNWDGSETLMEYAKNNYRYYGNDNDEADLIMSELVGDFIDCMYECRETNGVKMTPGISTFARQVKEWIDGRYATASGRRKGDILSGNISPTPMTDYEGPTAIIRSCCKCPLDRLAGATALDISLDPGSLRGEDGVTALMGLIYGFIKLKGSFMHLNISDPSVLEDALEHPERHQNLAVRVSGWSSRFVTLAPEWQKMVIERAKNGFE